MSEPAAVAEAWFLRHGLPWFVDDVRERVAARLSRGRITLLVLAGLVVGGVAAVVAYAVATQSAAQSAAWFAFTVGFLAVLVAYALGPLQGSVVAGWAVRRAFGSLGLLMPLATRALPMLLLFITFLFINTEVWQVASALHGWVLWSAVLFFAAAGIGFLVPRLAEELDHFDDAIDLSDVREAAAGTPLEAAADEVLAREDLDLPAEAQVTGLQMVNLVLVLLVAQLVQVVLLSVAVFVFFLVFGVVAIRPEVIESWIGRPPAYPLGIEPFSVELIRVATFLAGFSGLYFTVTAITDDLYRREFFTVVTRELQRTVGTRVLYRHLRR